MAKDKKKDPKEKLAQLKVQVAELRVKTQDSRTDADLRRARKRLKRAQRRHSRQTLLSLPQQVARSQKLLDMINIRLDVLTKKSKKKSDDAHVHGLRKKSKSLNKRLKKLGRLQEKAKKKAEGGEKPAAPQS